MSSTNKTSLGLSNWAASDKPVREDFNKDNTIINDSIAKLNSDLTSLQNWPIASAGMSSDFTVTSTSSTVLPLSTIRTAGSGLSLSNKGILIGSGISYVLVSAHVYFYTGSVNAAKAIDICKNGSLASRCYFYPPAQYKHYGISPYLISVNNGDLITLQYTGTSGDIISAYAGQTFLTVQAV